jgi:Ca-activated chloride channel homolog
MKRSILFSVTAVSLIAGVWALDVWAQDPGAGSQTVARPRKKTPSDDANSNNSNPDNQAPIPSKLSPRATKDNQDTADATFKAETNVVNVDVQVIDPHGNPIPGIPRGNFRILEDNVPQTLTQFSTSEAPMTVAMVIEFSGRFQQFYSYGWSDTLTAAYGFMGSLKPDDYVAVIAYDLRSTILSDFSNDRSKTMEALSRLRIPGFSESNEFDALADTTDRMSKIEGRKAVLLISSGIDTFSKLTYDKTRKALQEAGVPIYSVEILGLLRAMSGNESIEFLQGDNELKTFAKETGGQAYFPRFPQEMGGIFQQISMSLRNQYSLGYSPNNQARDGKFRKLTVQLVNPSTNEPLKMTDQKGKPLKYTVLAKAGYVAPRAVE